MTRFVKEGDTVLNIGSHIGLEAMVMGRIIGDEGRLFLFEPYSLTYNIMLKNLHLNRLAHIAKAYNVGAGNAKTKGYISVYMDNTGGSEIFTNESIAKGDRKTEEVWVDLVDDVLPADAVIDFALIDVERFELECLEGMKRTIARSPNIVIMCEWSNRSNNSEDKDWSRKNGLLEWFIANGFKFYVLRHTWEMECQYEQL
jgi:FkbM family methyltransferase